MKTLFLILLLALTRASAADTVWTTSRDNGCKPGVGLRFVQSQAGITSAVYLLDPEHPHDFSRGVERKITVTRSTAREVRFKIDWGDGKERSYVLQFHAPLEAKPVKGTLRDESQAGEPVEFTFTPAKTN